MLRSGASEAMEDRYEYEGRIHEAPRYTSGFDTRSTRSGDNLLSPKQFDSSPSLPVPRRSRVSIQEMLHDVKSNTVEKFPILSAFILSIYSTILSTFWFLVAVIKPHWGSFVANNGSITPSTASTLAAGFAKTIEMSFVTVFVICLGQYLTIRAQEKGIRTSDFQLKTLIVLPGSIFTQKGTLRAIWRRGLLGLGCVFAFLAAALYTTASDALVSPRPSLANPVMMDLKNKVKSSLANTYYVSDTCPTPFGTNEEPSDCITIEHAGAAFHNFMQYLTQWQTKPNTTKWTSRSRPPPQGLWQEALPVFGVWLDSDSEKASKDFSRVISMSSIAMPHMGIASVATMNENNLMRAYGEKNSDQLKLEAATIAPGINVTCTIAKAKELLPVVYSNWTRSEKLLDARTWLDTTWNETYRSNKTVLDPIFGIGSERSRPIFYKFPKFNQTVMDGQYSGWSSANDMLYILLKSLTQASDEYTMCGLNIVLKNGCSSIWSTNVTGSRLSLNCDVGNPMAFKGEASVAATGPDWLNLAVNWALAIALGGGTVDSSAAAASMLAQLVPTKVSDESLQRPSLADALAVLSICMLLVSTIDAPLDGLWPYTADRNILPQPLLKPFTAQVQFSDYSSGTTNPWENLFIIVLLATVILNTICLAYLIMLTCGRLSIDRHGVRQLAPKKIQKDITDLPELFATAINSPRVDMHYDDDNGEGQPLLKTRDMKWKHSEGMLVPMQGFVVKDVRRASSVVSSGLSTLESSPANQTGNFEDRDLITPRIPIHSAFERAKDGLGIDGYQQVNLTERGMNS